MNNNKLILDIASLICWASLILLISSIVYLNMNYLLYSVICIPISFIIGYNSENIVRIIEYYKNYKKMVK